MRSAWATSRPELFVDLDRTRVRASLEASLRDAIRTCRLQPNSKLPSSRLLATDLGIARNTVVEVYGQLVSEGWLVARTGAGTVVGERAMANQAPAAPSSARDSAPPAAVDFDLRGGVPDVSSFPRDAWLSATRRALRKAPDEAFGYQDARGRLELRQALAEYLSRARDVYVHPDQIIVCLGAMHGLRLIGKALRRMGTTVWATESYGLVWHRRTAADLGFQIHVVPVDEYGARIDKIGDAGSMLLSPAHQYPLGVALSPQRRLAAIEWTNTTGGFLIEDDYDGEFRHDRHPVGAIQSLAPERVLYLGTASKSLSPSLRIGWMVVPHRLIEPILRAKTVSEGHNSTIDQLTLAELLTSGFYDRHIRRNRLRYRHRRDQLLEVVDQFEGIEVQGISAGMHALLQLPDTLSESAVVEYARRHYRLRLEGLSIYAAAPKVQHRGPALVIGYGSPSDQRFPETLKCLSRTLGHFNC